MLFITLISIVIVIGFTCKDLLFWLYVLQLKEYRIDKLKDFFITALGYKQLFSKKNALRLTMLLGLVSVHLLTNGSPAWNLLQRILVFNVLCIMIFIDILPLLVGRKKRTIRQPDWTKRIIMVGGITAFILINALIIVSMHNIELLSSDSGALNLLFIFLSHSFTVVLSYCLTVQLLLPLIVFLGHLIVSPIAWLEKKRILTSAQGKIAAMPNLTSIGISGSYGKSSVKMLLSNLLDKIEDQRTRAEQLLSTPGNINTELGISQFVLSKLKATHRYFVAEFGTYTIGESKLIGEIVDQKIGFLTGLNNQHVGLFGSLMNAITAETEILIKLRERNGTIYANRDDHLVRSVSFDGVRLVRYSTTDPSADAYASDITGEPGKYEFNLHYRGNTKKLKSGKNEESGTFEPLSLGALSFRTDLIGKHNILNLIGVLACCLDEGIPYEILYEHTKRLAQFQKTLHISQLLTPNSQLLTCIDDTYNINQNGVKAGLDLLSEYKGKKIVFIDEIIELGEETEETHHQLGQTLAQYDLDAIYLTGKQYGKYIEDGRKEQRSKGAKVERSKDGTIEIIKKVEKSDPLLIYSFSDSTPVIILFLGRGTQIWLEKIKEHLKDKD